MNIQDKNTHLQQQLVGGASRYRHRYTRRCHRPIVTSSTTTIMLFFLTIICSCWDMNQAFIVPAWTCSKSRSNSRSTSFLTSRSDADNINKKKTMELEELKRLLEEYLEKRQLLNADELAQLEKGKVVGGTKGNKVLEFFSGAPNKEVVLDRVPNVFDYDQLTKYGYSNLVTPIMELGGRNAVYEMMGMEAPAVIIGKAAETEPRQIVIDRTGDQDPGRYGGMQMGLMMNDDAMAEALERARRKKNGEEIEEETVAKYSDGRRYGSREKADQAVERLDAYMQQRSRTNEWARRYRQGEYVKDPLEIMELSGIMQIYFVLSILEIAAAFGQSTPAFLSLLQMSPDTAAGIQSALQGPGFALALANVGSGFVCGAVLASPLNRNPIVWTIKGLLGGPLAVLKLRGAEKLITREETELLAQSQED